MSRPFAKYSAKASFGQIKEPMSSGDYIANKKLMYSVCAPNQCQLNANILCRQFNRNQLYANLYTKLDLMEISPTIPIIADLLGNTFPVIIDTNVQPFLKYVIDPKGALFGNSPCGIDNYRNYVVPNNVTSI